MASGGLEALDPKYVVGLGIAVAGIDGTVWALGVSGIVPIAWSLGFVGIITFLGVLILAYLVKGAFEKNEAQLAITASVLAVYFGLAPALVFPGANPIDADLAGSVIGHFTTVVEVVVAFYAGSTLVRYGVETWRAIRLNETGRHKPDNRA